MSPEPAQIPAQHCAPGSHGEKSIVPHQRDLSEAPSSESVSRVHIIESTMLIKPSEKLTCKMFQVNLHSPVTDLEIFIEHLLFVRLWAWQTPRQHAHTRTHTRTCTHVHIHYVIVYLCPTQSTKYLRLFVSIYTLVYIYVCVCVYILQRNKCRIKNNAGTPVQEQCEEGRNWGSIS